MPGKQEALIPFPVASNTHQGRLGRLPAADIPGEGVSRLIGNGFFGSCVGLIKGCGVKGDQDGTGSSQLGNSSIDDGRNLQREKMAVKQHSRGCAEAHMRERGQWLASSSWVL